MKTKIAEPDFIGGMGSLTSKEEEALAIYFAQKKAERAQKAKRKLSNTGKKEMAKP